MLVLADDEDACRMLWYAAFLKPLRDRCAVTSAADGGRRDNNEDEKDAGGAGRAPSPRRRKGQTDRPSWCYWSAN